MHRAPVAQLPGARTEHERVSLFVCVHQLAHVPRIARAVAGEKNVGARLRHGGHEKIDRALATVAIAALRCLGHENPARPRYLRRLVGRAVDSDSDHKFFGIDHREQLVQDLAKARFLIACRDNDRDLSWF